jgi:hypothetical protein
MLTVLITYLDGSQNVVDVWSEDEISLINVKTYKIIRDDRKVA